MHPYGRTFDLLSSEYGWTDDQILDLTLGRMRFARDMIMERLQEKKDWEIDLAEQVTKTLVLHIRSAARDRAAAKAARMVRLFKRKKKRELPTTEQIMAGVGGAGSEQLIDPNLVNAAYGPRSSE